MVTLRIDRIEPFADGKSFGVAGPYERVIGVARGNLDPDDPRNAGIVNLEKAQRNAAGLVEYETDVFILRPADPKRRNGKILYEFLNRGRKLFLSWVNEAPELSSGPNSNPRTFADAGTGFFLRDGWTLVWSGWDGTIARDGVLMGIGLPVATEGGATIERMIREEFATPLERNASAPQFNLTYEAVNLPVAFSRLTVRHTARGKRLVVPPERWTYADARSVVLQPEAGRFDPAAIYELSYVAQKPTVLGIGFAAVRDVVSWLRYEQADDVRCVLGIGISLGGRFAREFLELGMNADHRGRRLFDGLLIYIAGAGKTFTNFEFGQPSRTRSQHGDHDFPENWFPFAYGTTTDPATGASASICRETELDPFILSVNSSSEYWQKGASLTHTDPQARFDLTPPPNVRTYLIAGTQHAAGPSQQSGSGPCAWPRNPQSVSPVLRAMLVALDEWVDIGRPPPPSAVPTIADKTLIRADELTFPSIGPRPPAEANPIVASVDWVNPSGDAEESPYAVRVPAVDADGNEIAGIRMPDVAVARGTYAGWNYFSSTLAALEWCNHAGLHVRFAGTKEERLAAADPRPSLAERYGNAEHYTNRIEEVCADLVRRRYLLEEDVSRYVGQFRGEISWSA